MILVHGITSSLVSSLKYMEMFRKRNFHVLGGSSTTFGLYEKHDLNACVEWLIEQFRGNCKIGIVGELMGAATGLQHAAIDRRVAFYIADCPYSDLKTVLK
jgi:alpha/beta superfamily hydrolase